MYVYEKKITSEVLFAKFVFIYPRSQVSVHRTIGPLVVIFASYHRL